MLKQPEIKGEVYFHPVGINSRQFSVFPPLTILPKCMLQAVAPLLQLLLHLAKQHSILCEKVLQTVQRLLGVAKCSGS